MGVAMLHVLIPGVDYLCKPLNKKQSKITWLARLSGSHCQMLKVKVTKLTFERSNQCIYMYVIVKGM